MVRIGVFGASFNPPTRGHEDVINQALFDFDEILLVPSIAHPFEKKSIALEHRLAMLELFITKWQKKNNVARVKIFNIEPKIQEKSVHKDKVYTFDVMSEIELYYHSQQKIAHLQFILGPDNADPKVWKNFYRHDEIEKRWGIWVAKENFSIRSTTVRTFVEASAEDKKQLQVSLKKWVSEPIANYIIKHDLYIKPNRNSALKQPTLVITLVIFSITHEGLMVMVKAGNKPLQWSLPVTAIEPLVDGSLEQAAKRLFKECLAIEAPYLEQVQTVGFYDRVPGEWSVTVNYYGLINSLAINQEKQWMKLSDLTAIDLALDHCALIESCLQRFQNKSLYTSLPIFLLPAEFTLTELQRTYEIVLGIKMEKKSFRRRLLDAGFLEETGNIRRASHRPAQLYRLAHPQPYFFARIIEGVRENRSD